jgi:hypothetical protein
MRNAKDRANLAAHVEAVENHGARIDADKLTTRQKQKLLAWTEGAAAVDPEANETEAAAWQAVLESILKNDDLRMLDVVKSLSRDDTISLINNKIDAAQSGRFVALGLAIPRWKLVSQYYIG